MPKNSVAQMQVATKKAGAKGKGLVLGGLDRVDAGARR